VWPMFGFSRQGTLRHSQSGDDAGCAVSGPGWNQACREPGIQTHGGPDQEKTLPGLPPRCRAWGFALVLCPAKPSQIGGSRNREGSVSGGLFRAIH